MAVYLDNEAIERSGDGSDGYISEEIPVQSSSKGLPKTSKRKGKKSRMVIPPSSDSSQSDAESSEENTDRPNKVLDLEMNRQQDEIPIESQGVQNQDVERIINELKRNNSIIVQLTKEVRSTERRVKAIEQQNGSNVRSTVSTPKRSRSVPDAVRVSD